MGAIAMSSNFFNAAPQFALADVSPYETADPRGASLTGTLGQEAAQTWGMGAPVPGTTGIADVLAQAGTLAPEAPPPQAPPSTLERSLAGLGAMQAEWQAAKQQSEPFFKKLSINPQTGQVDISTSQGALAEVMGQLKDLQTMKSAAMARVAQLRQQEASGSPLIDALSQFAGNMAANDPTMPGWVRALGATNLAMGPQGIKRERMMEENRALGLSKEISDTAISAERMRMAGAQTQIANAEKVQTNWEQLRSSVNSSAQKGILPDKNYFFREGLGLGKDLNALESEWKNAETLSKNYNEQKAAEDQRAIDKAVAVEKGKAPIKIEVGKTLEEDRQDNRKELIGLRKQVASDLADKRYRMFQDRIITRMDANRVNGMASIAPKVRENLIATSEMEQFLERLETYVGPNGKLRGKVGPIQGFITGSLPSALSDSDRQVVQHLFGVEKKRVIDFARAGVRGWAPGEDAIRKVGMLETLTPDAAGRVIEEIRHQININRRAATQAFKYAPWDQMPELLGGPKSPVYLDAASKSNEFYSALEGVHQRSLVREGGGLAPGTAAPQSGGGNIIDWNDPRAVSAGRK